VSLLPLCRAKDDLLK
jgi:hypothetical protein